MNMNLRIVINKHRFVNPKRLVIRTNKIIKPNLKIIFLCNSFLIHLSTNDN